MAVKVLVRRETISVFILGRISLTARADTSVSTVCGGRLSLDGGELDGSGLLRSDLWLRLGDSLSVPGGLSSVTSISSNGSDSAGGLIDILVVQQNSVGVADARVGVLGKLRGGRALDVEEPVADEGDLVEERSIWAEVVPSVAVLIAAVEGLTVAGRADLSIEAGVVVADGVGLWVDVGGVVPARLAVGDNVKDLRRRQVPSAAQHAQSIPHAGNLTRSALLYIKEG